MLVVGVGGHQQQIGLALRRLPLLHPAGRGGVEAVDLAQHRALRQRDAALGDRGVERQILVQKTAALLLAAAVRQAEHPVGRAVEFQIQPLQGGVGGDGEGLPRLQRLFGGAGCIAERRLCRAGLVGDRQRGSRLLRPHRQRQRCRGQHSGDRRADPSHLHPSVYRLLFFDCTTFSRQKQFQKNNALHTQILSIRAAFFCARDML